MKFPKRADVKIGKGDNRRGQDKEKPEPDLHSGKVGIVRRYCEDKVLKKGISIHYDVHMKRISTRFNRHLYLVVVMNDLQSGE